MDISRIAQSMDKDYIDISLNSSNLKDAEAELKDISLESKNFDKNGHFDKKDFKGLIDKTNKILSENNTHLKFKIHEKTHDVMISIIDDSTGKVIKEIPPEKIVDMIAKMCENAGIFLDEKK